MAALLFVPSLSSCLGDDDKSFDYKAWRNKNEDYFLRMTDTVAGGKNFYEKITPDWAPGVYILAHWHNDRSLTAANLKPMDNSTVDVV